MEAIDPAPEAVGGIDFDRSGGRALRGPKVGLAVEISRHHFESIFAAEFGMVFQKFSDLEPQGIVCPVWILRSSKENQHQGLAFVDHLTVGIFPQQRTKELDFLLERGLSVEILEHDILVDATEKRNELEPSAQLRPRRIKIAGIVADGLVVNAEGRRAVRDIFLDEPLTVKDAAHVVRYFADRCVD